MITNALSVDVEEYYNSLEFEAAVTPDERSHSQVELRKGLIAC